MNSSVHAHVAGVGMAGRRLKDLSSLTSSGVLVHVSSGDKTGRIIVMENVSETWQRALKAMALKGMLGWLKYPAVYRQLKRCNMINKIYRPKRNESLNR